MSLITKMLKQKAIWWKAGAKDRFGNVTFDDPVEIDCRWEETGKEYLNAKGETAVSDAVVYVDRDISTGDFLCLGELDSNPVSHPLDKAGAESVKRFDKLPNLKVKEFLRTAYL